jgi:hypothetical protein
MPHYTRTAVIYGFDESLARFRDTNTIIFGVHPQLHVTLSGLSVDNVLITAEGIKKLEALVNVEEMMAALRHTLSSSGGTITIEGRT